MIILPPSIFTRVSKNGISILDFSVVNWMCCEQLFMCVKKSSSSSSPSGHMTKNVINISKILDGFQPVCVFMCLLKGSHEGGSKAGCNISAHGSASNLNRKLTPLNWNNVFS